MKAQKTNALVKFFLNPVLYISLGIATALVLPLVNIIFLWVGLLVTSLAIPAWYAKLWLPPVNNIAEDLFTEEDFIP